MGKWRPGHLKENLTLTHVLYCIVFYCTVGRCRYLSQYPRLLYFKHLLVEYNKLFNGQLEKWVAEGGPEVLVGQALEISKRR